MTPTKIASLALFFGGVAVLLLGRAVTDFDRGLLTGIALTLIGLSFLVDALLPGGSELNDEQEVVLRQNRIPHSKRAVKAFSIVIGTALTLGGLYLVSANG